MKRLLLITLCNLLWVSSIQAKEGANTEYTVGIDDVLEINVLQPEKLTTIVTVSPDGSISFPYIGNTYVKGLTLSTIQEDIQTRLMDGYMKYPVVSVSLKESRSRKFFVYGDVARPGAYSMEEDTTVLKAISIAGGFSKFGAFSQAKLLRPKGHAAGYETIEVDIESVMKGTANADIALCPGDTIMVSEGKFFVYGDVTRPGAYSMEEDTTVLKAISISGGLSKFGSLSQVKLLRPKGHAAGYETIEVDIESVMKGTANADIALCPGDTIMVSEGKFFVYGEVARPGAYSMEDNTTVLKAISIAGGFSKFGAFSQVKLLRPKGHAAGYEIIEVDIKSVMKGADNTDIALCSGDTVMVSEGKFFVYGEVARPGVYSMEDNTTVLKAISIAGGLTKFGSSSRIKVLRSLPEESGYETIKINLKEILEGSREADVMLKPGDTIVVMEGIF